MSESVLRRSIEAWIASDRETLEALWDPHGKARGAPLEVAHAAAEVLG
jgi:hypothetical protein